MRIAITGSHGVGKSTLINDLLNYLNQEKDSFKLLPEAPRQALQLGFPINENTPMETEFWIFAKQLEMELVVADNYIADKCFIDLLAYAMYIFAEKADFINILREIARSAAKKYDLVIYLPTGEFPIEDDGVRSTDHKFQEAIDKLILKILNNFGVNYTKITGNKDKRYNKAIELIKISSKGGLNIEKFNSNSPERCGRDSRRRFIGKIFNG